MRKVVILAAMLLLAGGRQPAAAQHHFHGAKSGAMVNYDSLFAAATPLEDSQAGSDLLEACLAAYGGRERLDRLHSLRLTFMGSSPLSGRAMSVKKSAAWPRRYRIDRLGGGGDEARILSGDRSWYQTPDTLMATDGGRYRAELFSYLVLFLPRTLYGEEFAEVRHGRIDGDPLEYLYLTKPDSLLMVVGIDPATGLVRRTAGLIRQEENTFRFENEFSDHEKHDGYLFPGKMTNISMGLKVSELELSGAEVNPPLEDRYFGPSP